MIGPILRREVSSIRRWFWILLGVSLILTGVRLCPACLWLWGDYGRRHYVELSANYLWLPLLLLVGGYVLAVVLIAAWLDRRSSEQCPVRPIWPLLGMALLAVLMQLAVMLLMEHGPLVDLFRRTVSPTVGGYFNVSVNVEDVGSFLRNYPQLMPDMPPHPKRQPPGLPLLFISARQLLALLPELADRLARWVRPDQCTNLELMKLSNPQLASAWLQMLVPPLAAGLWVLPIYWLGRLFCSQRALWWALAWVPLLPALVVFSPTWNQVYPLLTTLAVAAFWRALTRPSPAWAGLAGLLVSLSTFLSFANLIVFGPLGVLLLGYLYGHRCTGHGLDLKRALLVLGVFGAATASCWLAYGAYSGVTPFDIWRVAGQFHFGLNHPYLAGLVRHPADFFSFGGWVLVGLALMGLASTLRATRRWDVTDGGKPVLLTWSFWLSLAVLTLSGMAQGETSRVWMPYLPILVLVAATALERVSYANATRGGLVTAALAVNLLIMAGTYRPEGWDLQDAPTEPPRPPLTDTQPVRARFGELAELEGYRLNTMPLEDGRWLVEIGLNWHALSQFDQVFYVFVHLLAADGTRLAQSDSIPAEQGYPTTCWRSGQRISDVHRLLVPAQAPPGPYRLLVGLYRMETGERLPVQREGVPPGDYVELTVQ